MNKRLAFLEQLTNAGKADPFAFYGLALEYRKEGRLEDAVRTFEKLRALDADYLAMYLMAGQVLHELGRNADAKTWLEAGIALAQRRGDQKTLGELRDELDDSI